MTIVRKVLKPEEDADCLRPFAQARTSFENEEKILSLLRSLRHDNIVQLLASYTVLCSPPEHNLLFRQADAPLSNVLHDEEIDRLSFYFPGKHVLLQQLYGLSSAIGSLHDYFSQEYDLSLIGCHYDLAPRNILVEHGKLLLADFGLSKLRPDTSKSIFVAGKGDYLAPECEPLQSQAFAKGVVGRAGDIWSFGCILLEILVHTSHTDHKAQAVKDFRKKRRTILWDGEYTTYLFHSFDRLTPAVADMLDSLQDQSASGQRKHLSMIRDMLAIHPSQRPKADTVTIEMYFQAQKTIFTTANDCLNVLVNLSTALELTVERERFLLWGWGAKLVDDLRVSIQITDDHLRDWLRNSKQHFQEVNKLLGLILEEVNVLKATLESTDIVARPIYIQLRHLNDMLWALPPRPLAQRLASLLENRMLNTDDRTLLVKLQQTFDKDALNRNIALLAAIKYMTGRIEDDTQNASRRLLLGNDQLPTSKKLGIHYFGTIVTLDGMERAVLIERMSYDPVWLEEGHLEELYGRADALAELLNKSEMPCGFRVLRCTGYFLDIPHSAIGLVYDFPPGFALQLNPVSLKRLILSFRRPDLGTLFRLAYILASCVLGFHKTGWLHKNISSHNILFFDDELSQMQLATASTTQESGKMAASTLQEMKPAIQSVAQYRKETLLKKSMKIFASRNTRDKKPNRKPLVSASSSTSQSSNSLPQHSVAIQVDISTESTQKTPVIRPQSALQQPYLVGFDHSRPDQKTAFTSGPSRETTQKPYQHPEYKQSNSTHRFRSEFDYYSFGLVLLELGLWKSVEQLVQADIEGYLVGQEQAFWLQDVVPRLGSAVGEIYREAVKACLNGELASSNTGAGPVELFEKFVVSELKQCHA